MDIVQRFLEGAEWEPLKRLVHILALPEGDLLLAFGVVASVFFVVEFMKTYLMIEHVQSVAAHVSVNIMTILPAVVLVGILFHAGYRHPERAWINLGFAALSFIPWYIAGQCTFLARRDAEGADPGFMTVGLLMVLPSGAIAALIW